MNDLENLIGKNIKAVRNQRGISQETLAKACDFSNTTLSAYETGRKIPGLTTIAKIAKALNVSIERLYYGDENSAFIFSEPDVGKKIVNSIFFLWQTGTISYFEKHIYEASYYRGYDEEEEKKKGTYLYLNRFSTQIKRLLMSLNEFESKHNTYPEPEKYLEILFTSVANEINAELER